MANTQFANRVLDKLATVIPIPETELVFQNPYQLLVSVILSAQCTDKRVNIVTPPLFARFETVESLANASFEEVFGLIRSISYPNNKAKHLIEMAKIVTDKHQGEIPRAYEDLLALPGVGRKTANVMGSVLYQEPRMAVDTHVFRVAKRIGLAKGKNVLEVERELMAIIPEKRVADAHHYLILHGRYTCIARNPACEGCVLTDDCLFLRKISRSDTSEGI